MSDQLSTVTTTVDISGMTCSHCVASVTEELEAREGGDTVSVDLNSGGLSHATIGSAKPLTPTRVALAIAEAGYTVVWPEA